ncbi:MAG: hypothetical protein ABSB73_13315 [Solirubrobacteraceae bacterium]
MHELEDVPILAELGDQLKAGFRRQGARRRPSAGRLAVVAAGGTLAVIAVLAWGLGGGGFVASEASAAQELRAAADAAARQPEAFPGPRQFFYVRWLEAALVPLAQPGELGTISLQQSARLTIEGSQWWSTTRAGRLRFRVLGVTFRTPAARSLWLKLGRPSLRGSAAIAAVLSEPAGPKALGPHEALTLRRILALPTDPGTLYRRLFAGGDAVDALFVVRQLDVYPLGPHLRAALYRALALVRGVEVAGTVRTLAGSAGEAIGADGVQLIIDPRSGTLLGLRDVVTAAEAPVLKLPVGTVTSEQAIVARAITDSLTAPPR